MCQIIDVIARLVGIKGDRRMTYAATGAAIVRTARKEKIESRTAVFILASCSCDVYRKAAKVLGYLMRPGRVWLMEMNMGNWLTACELLWVKNEPFVEGWEREREWKGPFMYTSNEKKIRAEKEHQGRTMERPTSNGTACFHSAVIVLCHLGASSLQG